MKIQIEIYIVLISLSFEAWNDFNKKEKHSLQIDPVPTNHTFNTFPFPLEGLLKKVKWTGSVLEEPFEG